MRRIITVLSVAMGMWAMQPAHAGAAPRAYTIVQPIDFSTDQDPAQARAAFQQMAARIRKMPGLIDDELLQSTHGGSGPAYVHVMRWRAQRDWEHMFADSAFQADIRNNAKYFRIDGVSIFVPLEK